MHIIELDQITIPPNRQRKAFRPAHIESLRESILAIGLLHPPVFREIRKEDGGVVFQLVAGECRVRAIREIKVPYRCGGEEYLPGQLPITLIDALSPIARKEAELHENILRVDLTWQEKTAAEAELHALRVVQNPAQTVAATVAELAEVQDKTVAAVSKSFTRSKIVAENLHRPEVANARSKHEAYKIVSRGLEAQFAAKLAAATRKETKHVLLEGDLTVQLPTILPGTVDCIIADPPYGMGADAFGDAGAGHEYSDDYDSAFLLWSKIITEGWRVTKPSAHLYMFCDFDSFGDLRGLAELAGWSVQRTPIVWYKGTVGHNPYPGIGFRRTYELILFAWKGGKPCKGLTDDVIQVKPDFDQGHAAAKPVELFQKLLSRSCIIGDTVLDPTCGSGTIFPAATGLDLRAIGCEAAPQYIELSRARVFAKS